MHIVPLRPSRTLICLLALAHAATLGMLWAAGFEAPIRWSASLAVAASCAFHLRRDGLLLGSGAIVGLQLAAGSDCGLVLRSGEWIEGSILGTSLATPWLSVLNVASEGRRLSRHVVLFPDSLDAEAYRKLRVKLKWGWRE